MKQLENIRELAGCLAYMCNSMEYCALHLEEYGCPFSDNGDKCATREDEEKIITAEDWENVIRLLLPEKK